MPRTLTEAARRGEARRLSKLREALGFSQKDLAEAFGVTASAITQWELGDRTISGPVLRLMEAYENELGFRASTMRSDLRKRRGRASELALRLERQLEAMARVPRGPIAERARGALVRRYTSAVTALKPLGLKLARALDLFDPDLPTSELSERHAARVGQLLVPRWVLIEHLIGELGAGPGTLFDAWEPVPFVQATLSQLHAARFEGQACAVKVQYPNARSEIEADLRVISPLFELRAALPRGQAFDLLLECAHSAGVVECDYARELENLGFFTKAFTARSDLLFPRVIARRSSARVLTMTRLPGQNFADFVSRAPQSTRDRAAATVCDFVLQSIFRHHRVNTDIDPANFLFGEDRVACLDFGRVHALSQRTVQLFECLARAILERDRARVRELLPALEHDHSARFAVASTQIDDQLARLLKPALIQGDYAFTLRDASASVLTAPSYSAAYHDQLSAEFMITCQAMQSLWMLLGRLQAQVDVRARLLDVLYPAPGRRPAAWAAKELAEILRPASASPAAIAV